MPRKKKVRKYWFVAVLAFLLLFLWLLQFEGISKVVDPQGKYKTAITDTFVITIGVILVVLGVVFLASVWPAIGLIAVGLGIVASAIWHIIQRKNGKVSGNLINPGSLS